MNCEDLIEILEGLEPETPIVLSTAVKGTWTEIEQLILSNMKYNDERDVYLDVEKAADDTIQAVKIVGNLPWDA